MSSRCQTLTTSPDNAPRKEKRVERLGKDSSLQRNRVEAFCECMNTGGQGCLSSGVGASHIADLGVTFDPTPSFFLHKINHLILFFYFFMHLIYFLKISLL